VPAIRRHDRKEETVGRKRRPRLRAFAEELARRYTEITDPNELIVAGEVLVDGIVNRNPASLVGSGASITLRRRVPLRGEAKLRAALASFCVAVEGRVALDVGAAAGGFTRVLLEHGASRVYAVDAGYGQLLGSLRQDPRVVNHERVNVAALDAELVPDRIELVTVDLSYLSLARAVPQLAALRIHPNADLVALVKPMFELGLPHPPTDPSVLAASLDRARRGLEACDWRVLASMRSPVRGSRDAIEYLIHARRAKAHAGTTVPRSQR
jgi:23S rRNA (cytidine1920-2'-O)/16S rRNA (cytidine1409-2'-O)-methyltransferase